MYLRLFFILIVSFIVPLHASENSCSTSSKQVELRKKTDDEKTLLFQKRIETAVKIAVAVFIVIQLYKIEWITLLENLPRSMKDLTNLGIFKSCATSPKKFDYTKPLKFVKPLI